MLIGLLASAFLAAAARPAGAEAAGLSLSLSTAAAAPGDTLDVRVQVEAGDLALTSAAVRLLYDRHAFTPIAMPDPGGDATPAFSPGSFLPGQVYENTAGGGDEGWGVADYVVVSGVEAAGARPVGTGSGTLATLALALTGRPADGKGRVWLLAAGPSRATYTVAGAPGVGQPFAVAEPNPVAVDIAAQGLVPLADLELRAGEARHLDLGSHLVGADPETAWEVTSSAPDLVSARAEGDGLVLRAPLGAEGVATVHYTARTGAAAQWSGSMAVRVYPGPSSPDDVDVERAAVNEPPGIAAPGPLVVAVGATAAGPRLDQLVADPDDPYVDLQVTAAGDGRVEAWIAAGRLHLRGLSVGIGTVILRAVDPHGAAGQAPVPVEVQPPPQAPVIQPPGGVQVVEGGEVRLQWTEWVWDPDGEVGDLQVAVQGAGSVAARLEDGELVLSGLAAGHGQVTLTARDAAGNVAVALIGATVVEVAPAAPDAGAATPQVPPSPPPPDAPDALDLPGELDPKATEEPHSAPSPEQPAVVPLHLGPLPDLTMAPGSARSLSLGPYVQAGEPAAAFAVAGAAFLEVEVGVAGEVVVRAPPNRAGREVLVFTVTGVDGQEATALLHVHVTDSTARLELGPWPELEMGVGETRSVALDSLVAAGAEGLEWMVSASGAVDAMLEPGQRLIIHARAPGSGQVLVSATDAAGQRASDVLAVTVAPGGQASADAAGAALALVQVEPISLEAGGGARIFLDALVEAGRPDSVRWEVSAAAAGLARLDPASRDLVLTGTAVSPGTHTVHLTAALGDRQVALDLLVRVAAPAWTLVPDLTMGLRAGEGPLSLDLDSLVAAGDPESLAWQVSGGAYVAARVDAGVRRLVLDPGAAVPGREVFQLEARSGDWRRTLSLTVQVYAPDPVSLSVPPISGAVGDTVSVELAPFLPPAAVAEEVQWRLATSPQAPAWVEEGGVLQVRIEGDEYIEVAAQTSCGTIVYIGVPIVVSAISGPGEGGPETEAPAPAPEPGLAPAAPPLRLPDEVAVGPAPQRLALADLVPDGVDAGPGSAWQVSASGAGRAGIDGGDLVLEGTGDFAVALVLTTAAGSQHTGTLQVRTARVDAVAPVLDLRLTVDPAAAQVAVHLQADEPLAGPPAVWVDGELLPVAASGQGFAARFALPGGPGGTRTRIEAAGVDGAGNVGRATLDLVAGLVAAGESVSGAAGLVVHGPAGSAAPVWTHPARQAGGQYIGFDSGAAPWIEVQFINAASGTRLERLASAGWQTVPARILGDSGLWALVHESGVYRLVAGEAEGVAPALEVSAFPNPFNTAVAVRVATRVPGAYSLTIHDVAGRAVWHGHRRLATAGVWSAVWNGRTRSGSPVASGLYLAQVQGPEGRATVKLLLVR